MNFNLRKNKKTGFKVKIFLAIFLFVFLFVGFFKLSDKVQAENPDGQDSEQYNIASETLINASGNEKAIQMNTAAKEVKESSCSVLDHPIDCPLVKLLPTMGTFVSWSATLFEWSIKEKDTRAVLDGENIYIVWQQVRDALNMAFILFLLFSAFCTVFQISKYSFKSVMLDIVLMALLVNFSFPITRFIIDISNVLAYTIYEELLHPENGIALAIAQDSSIQAIAHQTVKTGTTGLLASFIFLFIFGITLLMMALLFIIRMIALVILIIFSPVAFTGSIIPGLKDKASKWWTELFNYAFFAPIMLFMLHIALSLMDTTTKVLDSGIAAAAADKTSDIPFLVNMSKFVIPIIILWLGMGIAKGMSVAGAGAITDWTQGKLKGWGKSIAKSPWTGVKKAGEASGITGGVKQAWKKKVTQPLEQAKERRGAVVAGVLGDKGAKERNLRARASQYEKDNETDADLEKMAKSGDAAAALAMANKGTTTLAAYSGVMANLDPVKDKNIIDLLDRKTREKKIDIIVDYKINKLGIGATAAQKTDIALDELNKLDPDKWKDQDIQSLLSTSANAATNTAAAQSVFSNFNSTNKEKVTENMKGNKYTAGKGTVWP